MEQPPPRNGLKPSGIPRISRLPVPKSLLRPVQSTEELLKISPPNSQHLRQSASREKLIISPKTRTPSRNLELTSSIKSPLRRNFSADPTQTPTNSTRKSSRNGQLSLSSQTNGARFFDRRKSSTTTLEEHNTALQISPRNEWPSLSERTVETLQNIPLSPALRDKDSGFFINDAGSRSNSTCSLVSGSPKTFSESIRASANSVSGIDPLPVKRPTAIRSLKPPSMTRSATTLSSNTKQEATKSSTITVIPPKTGNKVATSQSLKSKNSVQRLRHKPSVNTPIRSSEEKNIEALKRKQSTNFSTSAENVASLTSSKPRKAISISSKSGGDEPKPRQSSIALRDQIAKAKAAKRAASSGTNNKAIKNAQDNSKLAAESFDFQSSDDSFNQKLGQNHSKELLIGRIRAAQMDGRLNISAMGLKDFPEEVLNMYSLQSMGTNSWAEAVDLIKLVAGDNEFERISDHIFPDIDPQEYMDSVDEVDDKENQFAALEMIDLRRNKLSELPKGLRRLEMLTSLNLSNNFLDNSCFNVISQIKPLRDLSLDGNKFSDQLDPRLTNLKNLEILSLRHNNLTALPDSLSELGRLHKLNISENKFESLPFRALSQLPLTELIAVKNNLNGALIPEDILELPHLQVLDVTGNSLTSLHISANIKLPAIYQLNCSFNRLENLPRMADWACLITISAENNNISVLPQGFFALPKIKNVNFSGNNIKILDEKIARMASLEVLLVNGNPLRDKKFIGLCTEDLKRALEVRLDPEAENEKDSDTFFSSHESPPISPSSNSCNWVVQAGGILDRSNLQSDSLDSKATTEVAAAHQVKVLQLHHNEFKVVPNSISSFASTLTTLNLSHNNLSSDDFFDEQLELPVLKELNLNSNSISSLQPICLYLKAPTLERLDISFNRVTTLPVLRKAFPGLLTLLASHNKIEDLVPESIKGLQVVDCASNEIASLNSRIGLLGGPGGLKHFDICGNRFRVPSYSILEKGTEATLAWLRARVPEAELGELNGDGVD